MRHTNRALLLLFPLLLAACLHAHAQEGFDYDAYEPRTLAELIAKDDSKELADPKRGDGSKVFGASFPSRVWVTYTGESRPLSDARAEFIGEWVKTYGMDARLPDLFTSEWKFSEGKTEYWLPVQKQVASYFAKELKKGDGVELYVIIAGGRKTAGKWDWVILVNEFQKVGPPRPAL